MRMKLRAAAVETLLILPALVMWGAVKLADRIGLRRVGDKLVRPLEWILKTVGYPPETI